MSSYPLFWPSGRKLFRQRARGHVAWVVLCMLGLAVFAVAASRLGWF